MGRKKKKTRPLALIWSQEEEEREYQNDVEIWRMTRKRIIKELELSGKGELDRLLQHAFGENYHFLGIMAMSWKELLKTLRRSKRLQAEQEALGVDPKVDSGAPDFYGPSGRSAGYTIYPKTHFQQDPRHSWDQESVEVPEDLEGLTIVSEEELFNDFTNESEEDSENYEE